MTATTTNHAAIELAGKLDMSEYPIRPSKEIIDFAKANGLVIVYGASDDLMEFDGAFRDEVYVYGDVTVKVDAEGLVPNLDDMRDDDTISNAELNRALNREEHAQKIEAHWCDEVNGGGFTWSYRTDIPHATFEVMDDEEPYCRGIVFALADLK